MKKENNPLVSVLIATYNSEKYIATTLESIIQQTYKNLEILIADDASQDNTKDIVRKYQIKDKRIIMVENKQNLGIAMNMNNAIMKLKGQYVAILDGDDWAYPYRIEKQVETMEKDNRIVLCSGYMDICDEFLNSTALRKYPITDSDIRKALIRYNPISHPASMWRKSTLLKTSLYNPNLPICRDYDLIVRISELGIYKNIAEPLIKYRVRAHSETGKKIRETQWYSFYIQMKAHFEYKFPIGLSDIVFLILRLCATILLPTFFQRSIANNFSKLQP